MVPRPTLCSDVADEEDDAPLIAPPAMSMEADVVEDESDTGARHVSFARDVADDEDEIPDGDDIDQQQVVEEDLESASLRYYHQYHAFVDRHSSDVLLPNSMAIAGVLHVIKQSACGGLDAVALVELVFPTAEIFREVVGRMPQITIH